MSLRDRSSRGSAERPVAVDADRLEGGRCARARRARPRLAVHHGRDLGGRERHAGPLEHLAGGLRVGPAGELGREVGDRGLVGLDRAEARKVDAPRGRPVGRRVGRPDQLVGGAGVTPLLLRGRSLSSWGREAGEGERDASMSARIAASTSGASPRRPARRPAGPPARRPARACRSRRAVRPRS